MTTQTRAADGVMQDLVDCLLAEDFFGPEPLAMIEPAQWSNTLPLPFAELSAEQRIWCWQDIAIALRPGITQLWEKVPGTAVLQRQPNAPDWQPLSPEAFMGCVFAGTDSISQDNGKGQALFMDALRGSIRQMALSLNHRVATQDLMSKDGGAFFLAMEQRASLRDRPYHPLAKAKQGLNDADYQAYQAEFARPVALHWVAIEKSLLLCGSGVTDVRQQYPARYILPGAQRQALWQEMRSLGIAESHIALPVHPWQSRQVLEAQLGSWFADGLCQRLQFCDAEVFATSSLRSMTPCFNSADYLKLPMAVYSLASSRYLPAVKMINGGLSEALLRQGREQDLILQRSLYLCDENRWWAFMPPQATLFDDAPRHLSAQVRGYPAELLDDPDCRLMPMAALGTSLPDSKQHFFDDWLQYRQLPADAASVLTLFRELCHCFFEVNLRMFRLGMMGEVHGQNAVLVWKAGKADGLLLRDHDSLRIFVPWLERVGLADPEYRLKKGHPNTLYHQRAEDLLFWLQTLGIQVNMRAIIDTLADTYAIPAVTLWLALRDELELLIESIDFDDEVRRMIRHQLFEVANWPQKLLLTPMIERAGGPGSMPFGKGEVVNPFSRLARDQ
ncbi:Aerobactin synthase IucC [Serratia ficaria]|uniref:IucA/IucC family protein n=1 Tax=Enterobacterales TaxID=91347 RepID=UPI000F7E59BB|nr:MULTISPECIES: IucA/IucC family protein [Enterobacterales]RSV87644.1 AcsA protein [Klebsiella aerogenes]CAI1971528.1 Aerobactin synthase IucC [Serratia ficaria]